MTAFDPDRVKGLCFDIDGTLRDTDNYFVKRVSSWIRPLRIFLPDEKIPIISRRIVMGIETPGNALQSMADRLDLDAILVAIDNRLNRHLPKGKPDPIQVIPRTREMLVALQPHYQMAVVSARSEHHAMAFLDKFELGTFFSTIVTSQTCRYTKPHPDPVLYAARQMRLSPEACLMIGDTTPDIRAGKAARAQTVGVLCGFGEENELRRCGADLIVAETPDLVEILLAKPLVV